MSYFVCGLGDNGAVKAFADLLPDIATERVRSATIHLSCGSSFLATFDDGKAIQDVEVQDSIDGSWLALVGTPLVQRDVLESPSVLLRDFLLNPNQSLSEKLDGNFAAFAYDAPRKRLLAATDFNSTVPVFYVSKPGQVLFCSHELALAKLVKAELDPFGFAQAVYMGVTWGSHTRFRTIQKVLPSQRCDVGADGQVRSENYWRPQSETTLAGGLEEHIGRWLPLLKEAVWKYYDCAGRKPVLADFTAGEDGRLLLSQCHALHIPFKAHVTGLDDDADVTVAKAAAQVAGFELLFRQKQQVDIEQLLANALKISLLSDGYQDFFKSCTEFATDQAAPLDDWGTVRYCGLPGGEAFRGSYYLRGKALFPSSRGRLDEGFFIKMKYLLDFHPGLLRYPDQEFLASIHDMSRRHLEDVKDFPLGTQIDHLLRVFQTCLLGLKYKNPIYLPFATAPMTRSIYWLSPRYKKGGRLTKACTEILFPELAVVRTQNGVPTIRRTVSRLPLFLPEYLSTIKRISSGATSRLYRLRKSNKWYSSEKWTAEILKTLLNQAPYSRWLPSASAMLTGQLYQPRVLDPLLKQARSGESKYVPILGRVIGLELASRWAGLSGA